MSIARVALAVASGAIISSVGCRAPVAAPACMTYEPETTRITGILERRTFPGRPNYEDTATGDEPETGFYLRPPAPLCARSKPGGSPDALDDPRDSVRLVQLVLDSLAYARLRPYLGQSVTLRGTAFRSHTGHHHAPVLLTVLAPVRVER